MIIATVGHAGTNRPADVLLVQTLLNLHPDFPGKKLETDGRIGGLTVGAIKDFQFTVPDSKAMHPVIADGDPTARTLAAGMDESFSPAKLHAIMVSSAQLVDRYFEPLRRTMETYHIDHSGLRQAHFLAQLAHESGGLRFAEELASGEAYEGRADLGNTEPGDGRRFKGRGLIQLTGRRNYRRFSDATQTDYVGGYRLLSQDPEVGANVAGWFWHRKGLNALADVDDVTSITKAINGGYNGLDDRVAALRRARCLFGLEGSRDV